MVDYYGISDSQMKWKCFNSRNNNSVLECDLPRICIVRFDLPKQIYHQNFHKWSTLRCITLNRICLYFWSTWDQLMFLYHQPSSQHFGVDMNINNVVIFINFLLSKLWIFRKTKDFLTPGIDYLSRIWHNFFEFRILNALQLCTCLALQIFWYERHWWVLCRRNARLAY